MWSLLSRAARFLPCTPHAAPRVRRRAAYIAWFPWIGVARDDNRLHQDLRSTTWNPAAVSITGDSSPTASRNAAASKALSKSPRWKGLSRPPFVDEGQSERFEASSASADSMSCDFETRSRKAPASWRASLFAREIFGVRCDDGRRESACLMRQCTTVILSSLFLGFDSEGACHRRSPVFSLIQ